MPANARGRSTPCRVPVSIAIGSAITVVAALIILLATFFTVEQRTVAGVQRLGKFVQQAGPGLNLEVPFIDRVAGQVHQRVQQLDEARRQITSYVFDVVLQAIVAGLRNGETARRAR